MSILAIDIGGTWIKSSVVDDGGQIISPWNRAATPTPATPQAVLDVVYELAPQSLEFKNISIAFPGVVRRGVTLTAPNLDARQWTNFDLAGAVSKSFDRPTRVLNDAIVHGLGVANGCGLECIITFGTGLGFALFRDGRFLVQLELGRHMAREGLCYDEYVGHAAYLELGQEAWQYRVKITLDAVRALVNFDRLYVGGGNAQRIDFDLPPDISIVPVTAGVTGGARLWHPSNEPLFSTPKSSSLPPPEPHGAVTLMNSS